MRVEVRRLALRNVGANEAADEAAREDPLVNWRRVSIDCKTRLLSIRTSATNFCGVPDYTAGRS